MQGALLNSYYDRVIGWDNTLRGVQLHYQNKNITSYSAWGAMYHPLANQELFVYGQELQWIHWDSWQPTLYWMSYYWEQVYLYAAMSQSFYLSNWNSQLQYATQINQNQETDLERHLIIYNSDLQLSNLTLSTRGNYYYHFDLNAGIHQLNTPPPIYYIHDNDLLNQNIPEYFTGHNEYGFNHSFHWSVNPSWSFYLHLNSIHHNQEPNPIWTDYFFKIDINKSHVKQTLISGIQTEKRNTFVNLGSRTQLDISQSQITIDLFHQQLSFYENFINPLQYYDQQIGISLGFDHWSIHQLYTLSTNPIESSQLNIHPYTQSWLGYTLTYWVSHNSHMQLFAGQRKAGKICSGGLCLKKPELTGFELSVNTSF